MLTPVRRRTAAVSLMLLVPLLSGCGIGFGAQTDKVYQPAVGVNERSGSIAVMNAVIVSGTEGQGTFVASLVNRIDSDEDELTGITGDAQGQVLSPITVKPDTLVNLADTGAVSVTGDRVAPGNFVRLTLQFSSGQKTELNVPVVADDGPYVDVKTARPPATPTS